MCGIAAIAFGRRSRGRVPYPLMRELTKSLLVELQERGEEASGIAVINEGSDSRVFKKPLQPGRLVVRPMFQSMVDSIGPHTNFVLLHARAASVGDTSNNFNNHPIVVEPIVGIHNGTLYNARKLFSEHDESMEREGDVDSEVIFKLYHHFTEKGLAPKQAMCETGSLLWGAFTGALVDMRALHRMILFKNERPLCLISIPHYDVVVAVSESRFYARAAKKLGIKAQDRCESLEDGAGVLFDLNARGRITQDAVDFEIPVESTYQKVHTNWLSVRGGWWG